MTIEFTIDRLSDKQRVLADIIWSFDEFDQVEKFIATLGKADQKECKTIIELMKMAAMEQCYEGISDLDEANDALKKFL